MFLLLLVEILILLLLSLQDLLQDLRLLWSLAWDIWCGASLLHLLHLDKWFLGLED
jgi:hypothetical protein